jgi:hypothetical protein
MSLLGVSLQNSSLHEDLNGVKHVLVEIRDVHRIGLSSWAVGEVSSKENSLRSIESFETEEEISIATVQDILGFYELTLGILVSSSLRREIPATF